MYSDPRAPNFAVFDSVPIICHRCHWYRWCTLTCEYLREFLKKFEMTLMLLLEAWGKMIHEKKTRSKKSRDIVPLIPTVYQKLDGGLAVKVWLLREPVPEGPDQDPQDQCGQGAHQFPKWNRCRHCKYFASLLFIYLSIVVIFFVFFHWLFDIIRRKNSNSVLWNQRGTNLYERFYYTCRLYMFICYCYQT